jgi:hypothetical protein
LECEKFVRFRSICLSDYLPDFVWLATGGKQNINLIEKAAGHLKGRKVVLFPDLTTTTDWKVKALELQSKYKLDISVSDYLERIATEQERAAGLDLADYFLRNPPMKATAEPQPALPTETLVIERLQPGTIKSTTGQETATEVKETAQNRVVERLTKTQGGG